MKVFLEVPVAHKNLINSKILEASISIVGAGHLGSWVAHGLSLIGATEFYLYDDDIVETRNLSGTPYLQDSIGKRKVEELTKLMEQSSVGRRFIYPVKRKVKKTSDFVQETEFYIVTTDSLKSRHSIFKAIQKTNSPGFLIDMRSRAKISEVYAIPLDDEIASYWYEVNLKSRKKDPTPPIHCNEANIVQNSMLAASVAIQILSDVLDEDRRTRYFRLGIDHFSLQEVEIPLITFEEELKKSSRKGKPIKSETPSCRVCNKKHRSKKLFQKCEEQEKRETKAQLPDRSELFKKRNL
ncbi:MAG: ThiF family adenylyltransferase [Candidatus Kariarchaeaceae archaeon]|jgi:molybdopterin/thiamine biosynthesis adenylyltransferase